MPYLLQWTPEGVVTQLRMSETISIIIIGLVGFAVAFQFPIGVLVLVYMGVLTPKTLKEHRRIALVSMALASAILTPPDPFSMLIMLIPMAVLYEVSILVAMVVARRHPADETAA
jgi:sec-independent protein translocase protein TatC